MQHTPEHSHEVRGFVLNRDTNVGIPRLVVGLYDWDLQGAEVPQQARTLARQLGAAQSMATASSFTEGDDPDGRREMEAFWQSLREAWLEELQEREDGGPLDPLSVFGERIGSTLTEEDGSFRFAFDPASLATDDPAHRPDLILLVMAPEDSLLVGREGPDAAQVPGRVRPFAASPFARILHLSLLGRGNAGRREAYVVRLLPEQLERFRLETDGEGLARRLVGVSERARALEEARDRELDPKLRELARGESERMTRATAAFDGFSVVPPSGREDGAFLDNPLALDAGLAKLGHGSRSPVVISGEETEGDPAGGITLPPDAAPELSEAETDALTAQLGRFREGLLDIRRISGERTLTIPSGSLRGGPVDDVTDLPWSTVSPSVSPRLLDATRARDLIGACADASRRDDEFGDSAEAESDEGDGDDDGSGGSDDDVPGDTEDEDPDTGAEIMDRVLGQIQQLRAFDPDGIRERADCEAIRDSLASCSLAGGPADVTAYHFVDHLQVAFKHVWSQAFDDKIADLGRALYRYHMEIREKGGLGGPEEERIREVNDLRSLIGAVSSDIEELSALSPVPGEVQGLLPEEISYGTWNALSANQQETLIELATAPLPDERDGPGSGLFGGFGAVLGRNPGIRPLDREERQAMARDILSNPEGVFGRAQKIILELSRRLAEPYAFDIFTPGSTNFGIVLNYRQRWEPINYQVGELVSTIPLAPGEVRKYRRREVISRKRFERTTETTMTRTLDELQETRRARDEIMRKATATTNFKQTGEGGYSVGFWEASGTTEFSRDQESESSRIKKDFREAVRKATEEYKRERKIEIETTSEEELETTSSGEIKNPNDELTVTYLFYELQRRYRVSEQLNRVQPVVLVAQDVPRPNEIDDAWLIEHQWILRRYILDNSFLPALDSLTEGFVGEEVGLRVLRENWDKNRRLVSDLKQQVEAKIDVRDEVREEVQALLATVPTGGGGGPFKKFLRRAFVPMGPAEMAREARGEAEAIKDAFDLGGEDAAALMNLSKKELEARKEAAQRALEFVQSDLSEAERRLRSASTALQTATDRYVDALRRQSNRRTLVDQLKLHVKNNILHYMQLIWDHEPTDQRFFRLYDKMIPWVEAPESLRAYPEEGDGAGAGDEEDRDVSSTMAGLLLALQLRGRGISIDFSVPDEVELGWRRLVEVADLDNPIGYKGNYVMFPLKDVNYITAYMMGAFVDDYFGVWDPDDVGNFTTAELAEFIRCVWERDEVTDEQREELRDIFVRRLANGRRESEELVVPTGEFFIEALPGSHPLLEDFKLHHRAVDVARAGAEVRHEELENLRLAARLVADRFDDPDVEKYIRIEGDEGRVLVEEE